MHNSSQLLRSRVFQGAKIVILGVILGFGLQFVYSWTAPTEPAPGGNVEAPVTVSGSPQVKKGPLVVNQTGQSDSTGMLVFGRLGIGVISPQYALHANGNVVGSNIQNKRCPSGQAVIGFDGNGDILCDQFTPDVTSVQSSAEADFTWCDNCDGGTTRWYYDVNLLTGQVTCTPQYASRGCTVTKQLTPVVPADACTTGSPAVDFTWSIVRANGNVYDWWTPSVTQAPTCGNNMIAKIQVVNKTGKGDDPGPWKFTMNFNTTY